MTRESVDMMLKNYRMNVGRCGYLEAQIDLLEKQIKAEESKIVDDLAAIKPQQITDMPHGTTVGNPTEKFGIMLASGWTPEHIKQMREQLDSMTRELSQKMYPVLFVKSWLNGLTQRERWIVENQMIDAMIWKDIIERYKTEYHEEVSKDSLKRLKSTAMNKIYKMAE